MKRLLLGICLLTAISGCDYFIADKYSLGTFPETPANLGDINSADDDYNSTLHSVGGVMGLVFSSKRGGRADFNFVHESLNVSFDLRTGKSEFNNRPYGGLGVVEEQSPMGWAAQTANSSANELGPYLRSFDHDLSTEKLYSNAHYGEYLMLFASDRTGNLDIYLTHNYQTAPLSTTGSANRVSGKSFTVPVSLPFLNSPADDGYPTFDKTYGSVYFTSNRGGSFAIYKATLPTVTPTELQNRLPDLATVPIERVAVLSSSADDKCPFIAGNTLVFTSNRPGGYGGYDLYYSKWDGSNWSAPVNFGSAINTAYDEYRPVVNRLDGFTNQVMIFSSNRPGGKGGFDLYRVGIPE